MKTDEFGMVAGMAFRNLSRHRTKTVITCLAVAVSVSMYIFMDGWIAGMNIDSKRNIVSYEMGAAKIQSDAYYAKKDDLPSYENFSDWEEIAVSLSKAGFRSAPRAVFTGTVYSRSAAAPMTLNAVDVERETALLRYGDFIDAGRFPRSGKRELVLGAMAAEKLKAGIPARITEEEFETDLGLSAMDRQDAAFLRSLYVPWRSEKKRMKKPFAPVEDERTLDNRLVLREDIGDADMDRAWSLLSASGRMDVRIATTVDIRELPASIPEDKFDRDILELVVATDRKKLETVYTLDAESRSYLLAGSFAENGTDAAAGEQALRILLDAGYPGAVRHVNQLIDAVVTGVVNSPNPKTNGNIAFMPMDALQDEAGMMLDGRVTEIMIRSADAKESELPGKTESADAIAAALESASPGLLSAQGLSVRGWEDYSADYIAAAAGDRISTRVMIAFLFFLSLIGIANTMLMAILERTKEIGMLRALGMTDGQLLLSYVAEATLVGLLGSAAGVLVGCLINIPMVTYGIDYSAVTDTLNGDIGYRIASYFRSAWNVPAIVGTFVAATVLSGCMAVLPTLRALKMPVTESLRFE